MKEFAKRGLSMLLALIMCFSLITVATPMEAEAASYTYNWGTREDVADEADFTYSTAEEWYDKHNASYEELSQLDGSATLTSVPNSELYLALQGLMVDAHGTKTSYDGTKSMYQYTDCENGGGKISSFYSGTAIGPGWGEGGSWNREHTWPKSKSLNGNSNGGQDETDIMMLRPTTTSENSSRGNTAYGEKYYDPNEASGGKLNLHGDCARICLYVYVRWGNSQYMWGSSGVMESLNVLLKWMEEDPVDTWELGRNDSVESITGTRNVFVDYPELGFLLFNEEVPANYSSPSGAGNATSYSITATTNNTSYGTVSVSGKTITATPKTGYYVSGYAVTSGTATVTQDGNTFKVNASSNCSIRIDFAAKTAVTVKFMENGILTKTLNAYGGDTIVLPQNANTPASGYSFLGWVDGNISDTTEKPTFYAAGSNPTASNKTYYALYSYAVGGSGVTEYVLSKDIKAGDTVVITNTKSGSIYALPNGAISKNPAPVQVTAADGKLTGTVSDSLLWTVGGSKDAWTFTAADSTDMLYCNNDNAGVAVGSGANNTFKVNGTYLYNNGTSRYLGIYNTQDWRCYISSSTNIGSQVLGFYVMGEGGTVYYTTSTYTCEHEDVSNVQAEEATCTEGGYTAGKYCNDCGQYIEGHEAVAPLGHSFGNWTVTTAPTCTAAGVETRECANCDETETQSVAATGHSYEAVVTPPTTTEQGYTTYTCTACGNSYVGDYTEELGYVYKVSFCVPTGVTEVADMNCGKNGITLPVAEAPEGYTFAGWTTTTVEDTETAPTVYTDGFTATADTTLYALYTYVVGGTGSTEFVLTDLADISETDEVVITMAYGSTVYALPNNGGSNAPDAPTVTVSGDKLASTPADTLLWNVKANGSNYSFYVNGDTDTLYCTNANKGVKIGSSSDNVFVLDASGYLKNTSFNRFLGVYRTNPDWRCYTSTSTNIGDQTLGFYVKGQAGTTWYTTLDAQPEAEPALFDIDVSRMVLGNALEFQFGVAKSRFTTTEGYYAVIEKTWADGSTTTKTVPAEEWGTVGTYWAIVYDGMAAKEMGDVFNVTIYNADGVAVSNAKTDSVRDYVMRNVDKQSDVLKTLMVNMLNYGAAAQLQFNYATDDLANSLLTDTQKAWASTGVKELNSYLVKGTNYMGTRLVLESRIQLQVAFKGMTRSMYAIYTYTDNNGKAQSVRVEGADFVDVGVLGVEMSALVYADARNVVEITVYNADGTVYGTATDSIEGYAKRNVTDPDDVVMALMKFADSAKAYLYGN